MIYGVLPTVALSFKFDLMDLGMFQMHLRLWENLVGPEAQHMAPFLFPPVVWLVIFSANEHRREGFEDVTQDSLTSC